MEHAKSKNFEAIINETLNSDEEIVKTLKKEKVYVVIPDEVVAFDSLEVPTNSKKSNEHFMTKFNLIYNKN